MTVRLVTFGRAFSGEKKEYIWNETVLRNKTIKQSFDEYKDIGSDNSFWPFCLYFGGILGAVTPILSVEICLFFANKLMGITYLANVLNIDQLLSFMIPLLMLLAILFLIIIIEKLSKRFKEISKEDIITNYNRLSNQNLTIASYIVLFFVFYLTYFSVVFKISSKLEEYLFLSIILFFIDGVLLILVLYSLLLTMRSYRYNIKTYLNSKYSKKYPYVHVSTIGGNQSSGQVKDIFNSKYLILNNEGREEIILWSSIDLLKIQEYKIAEYNIQKSIFEF